MKTTDTFIVSDIHLGSLVSRCDVLLDVLKQYTFKRLILLGDIFDDLNLHRLHDTHWEFLSYIFQLSHNQDGVEVVWISGNHDELVSKFTTHFLHIKTYTEYAWKYNNEKYLALHGHQFDRFVIKNKIVTSLANSIYKSFQHLGKKKKKHTFSRFLKRTTKLWMQVSRKTAVKALAYGKERGAQYVFCGHTHEMFSSVAHGVKYFNSGCWTDIPSSYLTIDEQGVHMHEVN